MRETKTVAYGYICSNCYHSIDTHEPDECRHIVERVYPDGAGFFMGRQDKANERRYCPCTGLTPIRVKTKSETERE